MGVEFGLYSPARHELFELGKGLWRMPEANYVLTWWQTIREAFSDVTPGREWECALAEALYEFCRLDFDKCVLGSDADDTLLDIIGREFQPPPTTHSRYGECPVFGPLPRARSV